MGEKSLDSLQVLRSYLIKNLNRMFNFVSALKPSTSFDEISSRLHSLEYDWEELKKVDQRISIEFNEESMIESIENKYFSAQATLLTAKRDKSIHVEKETGKSDAILEKLIEQQKLFLNEFATAKLNNQNIDTRLPKINIPIFSGAYKAWSSFKDLFEASVHKRNSISKAQKFQYLKGFLSGEAASLITHLPISETNYDEAWAKLNSRYDKKKHIANSFIKIFMSQSTISHATATNLRKLTDVSDEVLRGLNALGDEADLRDPWLIYILLNKLDEETCQKWSEKTTDVDFPKFSEFLNFLNIRCDALESSISTKRIESSRTSQSSVKTMHIQAKGCPKCNANHYLFQCQAFKSMNTQERWELVKQLKVCFNCLQSSHRSDTCASNFACHHCKKRHHSMLHLNRTIQSTSLSNSTELNSNHLNTVQTSGSANIHTNQPPQPQSATNIPSNQPSQPQSAPNIPSIQPISTPIINSNPNNIQSTINTEQTLSSQVNDLNLSLNSTTSFNFTKLSLLPTVLVHVKDQNGRLHPCRALLDSGSMASFITESCVQELCLKRRHARLSISGLASAGVGTTKGVVSIQLQSLYNDTNKISLEAYILPKLTSSLPARDIDVNTWSHIHNLQLADPHFNESKPIDILIGADKIFTILQNGHIVGLKSHPSAQLTLFGWVIAGEFNTQHGNGASSSISTYHTDLDIDRTLKRFWEIEEIPSCKILSNEEFECESYFKSTYSREESGKFIVKLPFRLSDEILGDSKSNAVSRLRAMERRFENNKELKIRYLNFMKEYLELGHMELVPTKELYLNNDKLFYLPHHAVLKESSTTTKLRVVFDASAKSSSNKSLNDLLMVGPTVQDGLIPLLLRFRKHKIVYSADIEKMYRQVKVTSEHTNFQRILWREDVSKPIQQYRLLTVTYGTSSAPFLATRVLQQLAEDNQESHPIASKIINHDFYVDDLMSGSNSVQEAQEHYKEIDMILKTGGFILRKWTSNSTSFLSIIPEEFVELHPRDIKDTTTSIKILGIQWLPHVDQFSFTVCSNLSPTLTKRSMLSESAKIFDPLGWLSPSVIVVKILFQKLWLSKIDWDSPLPFDIAEKWTHTRNEFKKFEEIKIPRWIFSTGQEIELHGFADASEDAYAAAIFCRCRDTHNIVQVNLLMSKSKVAPIKQLSIPKLELCAAHLLTKLMKFVIKSLDYSNAKLFAWTDSTIVLAWLSSHPRKWSTYVANRVAEILDFWPRQSWNHVPSKENPADCASRGISPSSLIDFNLWWHGPAFLQVERDQWPDQNNIDQHNNDNTPETKKSKIHTHGVIISSGIFEEMLNRYSSWSKIVRITAWILRYANNLRSKKRNLSKCLSVQELNNAMIPYYRIAQNDQFNAEIKILQTNKPVSKSSKLISLYPILDPSKILLVGGRIENANVSNEMKHPVILPSKHKITDIIIQEYHLKYLHAGTSLLTNILRQKYWILNARNAVKFNIHKCITCFRQNHHKSSQLMGNLPATRAQLTRPFVHTGVDYAGPVSIRTGKGKSGKILKAYISLFICLSTKAIHIELVTDLSTESFIAALKRFTSRRGVCAAIYSDNGTNFVGAKNSLNELYKLFSSENFNNTISHFLVETNTEWHTIPPSAPHFGGLWEANVKSIKFHLKRVIGLTILTYEELSTLLTQIECLLNSRPLCVHPDDELDALTPSHFLIGQPLILMPEPNLQDIKLSRLSRWQMIQQMTQGFWARWHREYLTSLQQRRKWVQTSPNISIGDLVIIRDDNMPPSKWLLGRVTEAHPGIDNLVRVVTLKTKNGHLKRPITKVFKLPLS